MGHSAHMISSTTAPFNAPPHSKAHPASKAALGTGLRRYDDTERVALPSDIAAPPPEPENHNRSPPARHSGAGRNPETACRCTNRRTGYRPAPRYDDSEPGCAFAVTSRHHRPGAEQPQPKPHQPVIPAQAGIQKPRVLPHHAPHWYRPSPVRRTEPGCAFPSDIAAPPPEPEKPQPKPHRRHSGAGRNPESTSVAAPCAALGTGLRRYDDTEPGCAFPSDIAAPPPEPEKSQPNPTRPSFRRRPESRKPRVLPHHAPHWVPACAGTTTLNRLRLLQRHRGTTAGTENRNRSPTRPSFRRRPESRKPRLLPHHAPLWVPACAGTTTPNRVAPLEATSRHHRRNPNNRRRSPTARHSGAGRNQCSARVRSDALVGTAAKIRHRSSPEQNESLHRNPLNQGLPPGFPNRKTPLTPRRFGREHVHDQADHCFLVGRVRFGNQQRECSQPDVVDHRLARIIQQAAVAVEEVDEQEGSAALVAVRERMVLDDEGAGAPPWPPRSGRPARRTRSGPGCRAVRRRRRRARGRRGR